MPPQSQRVSTVRIEAEDLATDVFDRFASNVRNDMREVGRAGQASLQLTNRLAQLVGGFNATTDASGKTRQSLLGMSKEFRGLANDIGTVVSGTADLIANWGRLSVGLGIAGVAGTAMGVGIARALGFDMELSEIPSAINEIRLGMGAQDVETGEFRRRMTPEEMRRIRGETELSEKDRAEDRRRLAAEQVRRQQERAAFWGGAVAGGRGRMEDEAFENRIAGLDPVSRDVERFRRERQQDILKAGADGKRTATEVREQLEAVDAMAQRYREIRQEQEKRLETERQLAQQQADELERLRDLASKAETIRKAQRTPEQVFGGELADITAALAEGFLSQDQAFRAMVQAGLDALPEAQDEDKPDRGGRPGGTTFEARLFRRGAADTFNPLVAATLRQTSALEENTKALRDNTRGSGGGLEAFKRRSRESMRAAQELGFDPDGTLFDIFAPPERKPLGPEGLPPQAGGWNIRAQHEADRWSYAGGRGFLQIGDDSLPQQGSVADRDWKVMVELQRKQTALLEKQTRALEQLAARMPDFEIAGA